MAALLHVVIPKRFVAVIHRSANNVSRHSARGFFQRELLCSRYTVSRRSSNYALGAIGTSCVGLVQVARYFRSPPRAPEPRGPVWIAGEDIRAPPSSMCYSCLPWNISDSRLVLIGHYSVCVIQCFVTVHCDDLSEIAVTRRAFNEISMTNIYQTSNMYMHLCIITMRYNWPDRVKI